MKKPNKATEAALADLSAQYAAQMQQSIAAALAELEKSQEQLRAAQNQAVEEAAAAREARAQIERNAEAVARAYHDMYRQKIEESVRQDTLFEVAQQLLIAKQAPEMIQKWLNLPLELLNRARIALSNRTAGFEKARVTYQQYGRGGQVYFEQNSTRLSFDWEFAGGDALALIFVPSEAHWEQQTGLPLEERLPLLDFVGTSVCRDQGGSRYELQQDTLVIY